MELIRGSGRWRLPLMIAGGLAAVAAATSIVSALARPAAGVVAQADAPEAQPHKAQRKPNRSKPKPKAAKQETKDAPAAAPAPEATGSLAAAAAAGANAAPTGISAKLAQAGAGACASTIDLAAVPSMVGVTQSNTISTWSDVQPRDKHAVAVFIGQRYGTSPTVPYGATGVIASPTPTGSCDATVVQVVSSPLPCANVRDTLIAKGKQIGELAGLPLIRQGDGHTLLMQTATNTCVLIGFRSTFGK